jgi:predicted nucleic acid-binding protein
MGGTSQDDEGAVTLLDTNVVIDAQNEGSSFFERSRKLIGEAVATTGAAVNAVILAELCAGKSNIADLVQTELREAGVQLFDLPADAAPICGRAYRQYRLSRRKSAGGQPPATPLPDFFIGAHAELMGWKLATRDSERFRLYFPKVKLIEPS